MHRSPQHPLQNRPSTFVVIIVALTTLAFGLMLFVPAIPRIVGVLLLAGATLATVAVPLLSPREESESMVADQSARRAMATSRRATQQRKRQRAPRKAPPPSPATNEYPVRLAMQASEASADRIIFAVASGNYEPSPDKSEDQASKGIYRPVTQLPDDISWPVQSANTLKTIYPTYQAESTETVVQLASGLDAAAIQQAFRAAPHKSKRARVRVTYEPATGRIVRFEKDPPSANLRRVSKALSKGAAASSQGDGAETPRHRSGVSRRAQHRTDR